MPATCGICKHAERAAIEEAHVEGASLRAIASRFAGTSPWSLARHFKHVPAIIAKVTEHQVVQNNSTAKLPARVEKLIAEAEAITMTARRKRDFSAALAAIRTRLTCLEMIGKLSGELRPGGLGEFIPANIQVNVGEQAPPKMTREQFLEHIRNIYGLPARKPPSDKIM
jgi:hypothetical protein